MSQPTKLIKITFDSFWCSGELTLEKKKALGFAKALHRSHLGFKRQVTWNGKYKGIEITAQNEHMKVSYKEVLVDK